MKYTLDGNAHRCHVCHATVIPEWESVCDECSERNRRFEEEMWQAERDAVMATREHRSGSEQRQKGIERYKPHAAIESRGGEHEAD